MRQARPDLESGERAGVLGVAIAIAVSAVALPAAAAEGRDFLDVVRQYADTMIERGRDTYGSVASGLLLSAMDRRTLGPLTTRPAAPAGIREGDRPGGHGRALVGANPQLDENLIRVLYALSELTGDPKYSRVADGALQWFLAHTGSPETGLLAWGEHLSWDLLADEVASGHDVARHEFSRPWVLWDRCFQLAPAGSRRFALGLWEHQIGDQATGAYDRHADYSTHGPNTVHDFPRHGGFYVGTWAKAYKHTADGTFLRAIEAVLSRFERKRHAQTGLINAWADESMCWPQSELSLAIDCATAAGMVPEPLASRLRNFAGREDEVFASLPHAPADVGFVLTADRATAKPTGTTRYEAYTTAWGAGYGDATTAMIAMMCAARYDQVHKPIYRKWVIDAANAYLTSQPEPDRDAWPMPFGHAISTELAAYRLTDKKPYLERARQLGAMAVTLFWENSPLPRASLKTDHYEAITGADTLALALLELAVAGTETAVQIPANTIDR